MSKHTPGPWFTGNAPHGDCRIYAPSEDHAIAKTYGRDLNGIGVCALTGPMNKADAQLIAAAPDLLEALCDMVSDHADLSAATLDYARAVIAKAMGAA